MLYIDENGKQIENPDLSLGYLVDAQWTDHPAQEQQGHYEYANTAMGGRVQTFVIDQPASAAWREVTAQKYILYTEDELKLTGKADYGKRLDAIEDAAYGERVAELEEQNTMLTECVLEMSEMLYA